jgi:hypothetical protein
MFDINITELPIIYYITLNQTGFTPPTPTISGSIVIKFIVNYPLNTGNQGNPITNFGIIKFCGHNPDPPIPYPQQYMNPTDTTVYGSIPEYYPNKPADPYIGQAIIKCTIPNTMFELIYPQPEGVIYYGFASSNLDPESSYIYCYGKDFQYL